MLRQTIENWVVLLRDGHAAWGLPLVVAGVVLMLMGWQFYRVAIPFTFFLAGLITGALVFEDIRTAVISGAALGILLAAISAATLKFSVTLLGGLVGSFALSAYLTTLELHLSPVMSWSAAAFGLAVGAALAFVLFREMSVVVTAFVGALLLISGLNAIMPRHMPTMYGTVSDFLNDYPAFFVPFLVGGPTLIGALYQIAATNRTDAGAA